jgi:hypothetical protein
VGRIEERGNRIEDGGFRVQGEGIRECGPRELLYCLLLAVYDEFTVFCLLLFRVLMIF